ncbi:MAG: hypothetical protein ABFD50_00345 [Smithella sp.]
MEPKNWINFLKKTGLSNSTIEQLRLFLGKILSSSLSPKKFEVHVFIKHQEGLTLTVTARDEKEAELIAINRPECSKLLQRGAFVSARPY